eukprot:scaffold178798_cov36-Tisochrysis_lutea.AAC.1
MIDRLNESRRHHSHKSRSVESGPPARLETPGRARERAECADWNCACASALWRVGGAIARLQRHLHLGRRASRLWAWLPGR